MKQIGRLGTALFAAVCMLSGCEKADTTNTEKVTSNESTTEEVITTEAETEEADIKHVPGQTTLQYIGHASIKIVSSDGEIIYIDPAFYSKDYLEEADIILVTHGHEDHVPLNIVKVKDSGSTITWKEAHPDESYKNFDIGDIHIEAVPAGNSNHKLEECVGYIITVDGVKIYHAGDTSMLDTMGELTDYKIDYALYPIDGEFNMDATEATEVANLIAAKNNIPIHENDISPKKKKSDEFVPEGRLILEQGETIVIKE